MSVRSSRKFSTRVHLLLLFAALLVLAVVVVSVPRSSKANQDGVPTATKRTRPAFVPGEALVRYKSETAAKAQPAALSLNTAAGQLPVRIEKFDGAEIVSGLRIAKMAAGDTLDVIEALNKQPDVLYAEPNYLLYPDASAPPNDPRYLSDELYGLAKIGAPTAWNTTQGSSSIVVAVIDEGVDKTHQDLAANIWVNPGEVPGDNVDNDGNGFIDDVNGYNFAANTGTVPGEFHATHVAGTIGAVGNNGVGVVGVNWNVRLMSLKFINGASGDTADAIRATNYAKQMKDLWESSGHTKGANIRVINNSYGGGGYDQSFLDAITAAGQSGILFVCAAGNAPDDPEPNNDLVPHYPASYAASNVIAVASTDSSDNLSGFSHFGANTVQIGAPGSAILSTTPGNNYSFVSGTSMASPHVAGAAALLLAQSPTLTVQQLRSLLIFNGTFTGSLTGVTLTGRRLSVANSFAALAENDVTPPGTPANFHVNTQNGRSLNVGWISSGDDGAAGQASLYQLTFTDATSGAVIPLRNLVPTASGASQSLDIKIPYRHTSGTLSLREFDNVGNTGTPATLPITISLLEGDPYIPQVGSPASLSAGGTPLNLNGDDKLYSASHGGGYPLPFAFPFFGQNYSSVDISTNGSLYFSAPPTRSSGDADDVPSSAIGLTQFKMISGLWDDLRTDGRVGDDVYVSQPDSTRIIFRWQGEIFGDGSNPAGQPVVNFEIELRTDGTIITRYGSGNTQLFPVVGIGAGEPDAYVIPSHTSELSPISLTNAPTVTFAPRSASTSSSVQFSAASFNGSEAAGNATITITRSGNTSSPASVDFTTVDGTATQKGDYLFTSGRLDFAAGETTKNITLLLVDDVFVEGTENFSVSLSNPVGTTLGAQNVTSVSITDNDSVSPTSNPLDNADARFFVRQHYIDFLNREPDSGGLGFWTGEITQCGANPGCIDVKRSNVSAAFFLSIEFQQTGYLAERTYKTAYGDNQNGFSTFPTPHTIVVPIIRFNEFILDSQQIGRGFIFGAPGADQVLENNKVAYFNDFVTRTRFTTAYPSNLTPTQFVGMLNGNAGNPLSAAESNQLIADLTGGTKSRAQVLRAIAEHSNLVNAEKNRAFVLMQYFGYLRRDPNSGQDTDHTGYDFWLTKLLGANGNYIQAEMVRSFLVSEEYRKRFGP